MASERYIGENVVFEKMLNEGKTMEFFVKNVDLSIINSLRRTILSDLDNVGFFFDANEHYEFPTTVIEHNDTPLHNEFLNHRISMIPIHVFKKELEEWESIDYNFEINVENNTGELLNVTSGDIMVSSSDGNKLSNDVRNRLFPKDPFTKDHILITKLSKNNNSKLIIKAKAQVNKASRSVSFGLVSKCCCEMVVDDDRAKEELARLLSESHQDKHKEITNKFNNLTREKMYKKNKYLEPNFFKISIESECAISCIDIYSDAIRQLKLSVERMLDKNYKVKNSSSLMTIIIPGGSHTTGNLIQALSFNSMIREKKNNVFGVTYIGYNIPHPLDDVMIIKIKGDELFTIEETLGLFKDMLKIVIIELTNFENEWNIFSSNYNKTA
jgi:DNA-directed RNA polymerase alpha subunit